MPTDGSVGPLYLKLIKQFPLRPLRDEADLDKAIDIVTKLTMRVNELTQEELDYCEVLGGLIHRYEAENDPLPDMTPVEAIRALLRLNNMTQSELSRQTGLPAATISEILSGKRNVSPKVRAILAERFKVTPSLFV